MNIPDKLLAIEAVRALKSRYFRSMDLKDWTDLAQVFAVDAQFDARASFSVDINDGSEASKAAAEWNYHGRDAIIAFIRGGTEQYVTVHHGHCHEVTVNSAEDAHGVIAMEDYIYALSGGSPRRILHGCGHYHETYRCTDGVWRIQTSRLTRLYVDFSPLPGGF